MNSCQGHFDGYQSLSQLRIESSSTAKQVSGVVRVVVVPWMTFGKPQIRIAVPKSIAVSDATRAQPCYSSPNCIISTLLVAVGASVADGKRIPSFRPASGCSRILICIRKYSLEIHFWFTASSGTRPDHFRFNYIYAGPPARPSSSCGGGRKEKTPLSARA